MRAFQHSSTHAFDLLINPEAVVRAMERSSRLRDLRRKVCRPLDKVARVPVGSSAVAPVGDDGGDDDT